MKLIVTTNWEKDFLNKLDGFPVEWICGRLPVDLIGSSTLLPFNFRKINIKQLEKNIKKIHAKKIKFNYVMDAMCFNNIEYTDGGVQKVIKYAESIIDAGADSITVGQLFLMRVIKKISTKIKICINLSTTVAWFKSHIWHYDKEGVDYIIIPASLNRNIDYLQKIFTTIKAEPWLVVNSGCLSDCPFGSEHANFISHISNNSALLKNVNYYNIKCSEILVKKPYYFFRSGWIMPEHLKRYEGIGYSSFVLIPNTKKTKGIVNVVRSYSKRQSGRSFVDLLSFMGKKAFIGSKKICDRLDENLSVKLYDEFFKKFPNINCAENLCEECAYCTRQLKKKNRFLDSRETESYMTKYREMIEKYLKD